MATFIIRYLRNLFDVNTTGAVPGDVLTLDVDNVTWVPGAGGGGGGAPTTADYLVGTANASLTNEIVVGPTPGGELGGTWASPTVDTIHSGSSHQQILDQAVILAPAVSTRNVIQPTAGTVIAAIIKAHAAQSVDLTQWQDSAGTVLAEISSVGALSVIPSSYPTPPLLVRGATNNPDFSRVVEVQDSLFRPRFYFELFEKEAGDGTDTYLYLSHGMGHAAGEFSQIDWNFLRKDNFSGTMSSWAMTAQSFTDTSGFWGVSPYSQPNPNANYPLAIDWATSVVTLGANAWDATDRGGSVLITSAEAGRSPLLVRAAVGGTTDILGLLDSSHVVLSRFNKAGYFMTRKIAAPADGDLVASELSQWYDSTNGAAKFMLKGKTVDGTVATWEIPSGVYTPGGGAPSTATYITQTPDAGLSAEQALSALATGLVKNTTGTGVLSIGAQGTDYYAPGGTDVAVADGGTGASTAATARANLQAATRRTSGYVVGQYYYGEVIAAGGLGGVGTKTVARAFYVPFIVDVTTTFDRIACYITVNGGAGALQRMGIYNDNNGVPGTVLLDAGTVATDAGAAAIKAITISQQLTPGTYWLASVAQTASATMRRCIPLGTMQWLSADFNGSCLVFDGVTGAFGNNPTPTAVADNPATCALRALSSP